MYCSLRFLDIKNKKRKCNNYMEIYNRPLLPKYNIYCYNNWHYGDLILLRPLYKRILESRLFKIKLGVYKNTAYLYEDMLEENFELIISDITNENSEEMDLKNLCPAGYLPVNLWLGQYAETKPHTWKSTVLMFNNKMLENHVPYQMHYDPRKVPMADFPEVQVEVKSNAIYVENGRTRSGHSSFMFDFELLTSIFPNCYFYCTAKPRLLTDKIVDCSDKNFIELSNISNKCIAILGKGSGPLLCTFTEKNRFKPRAVCGYNVKKWPKFWTYYGNPIEYINTTEDVVKFIQKILDGERKGEIEPVDKYKNMDIEIQKYLQDTTEMTCSYSQNAQISKDIATIINKYVSWSAPNFDKIKVSELRLKGFTRLDNLSFNEKKINDIINYFENIPMFSGHVPAQSDKVRRFLNDGARGYPFGSYELEDSIQCPHLLDLALSEEVLSLVEGYLGCTPTIYSINTWWSFPGYLPTVSQDFHRDVDDFKFLALFVYLTDVQGGEHGGQHQFITHTHHQDQVEELLMGDEKLAKSLFLPDLKDNGYNQSSIYEKYFKDKITNITGKAGSIFLADTFALHKGVPPLTSSRLVCWIRYGLRKNLTYSNDETLPVPYSLIKNRVISNIKNNYMLRLLTTENSFQDPVYQVKVNKEVRTVTLEKYDWKLTKRKYNLQVGNILTRLTRKITHGFKELIV